MQVSITRDSGLIIGSCGKITISVPEKANIERIKAQRDRAKKKDTFLIDPNDGAKLFVLSKKGQETLAVWEQILVELSA
jgi:3'-phosphoadenosine 5'-phosphosulfate (PAPS) 3'-phosphatase